MLTKISDDFREEVIKVGDLCLKYAEPQIQSPPSGPSIPRPPQPDSGAPISPWPVTEGVGGIQGAGGRVYNVVRFTDHYGDCWKTTTYELGGVTNITTERVSC